MRNTEQDFWNKVDKITTPNGCWEWQGYIMPDGYGRFNYQMKGKSAHKCSYTFTYGDIPEGLVVMHICDNPRCVRPSHLKLGTYADNSKDMTDKNRQAKGINNGGGVKLTEQQVIEIRNLYATTKISYKQLALKYDVTNVSIGNIIKRKKWKHI